MASQTDSNMAEIWELARFIEDNPDDYPERWRLAKKLYMAWEYRLALEHLQVLKNEWKNKQNVLRYLAATYYRLGRYDEAIHELNEALEIWPDEVGLHEQLARVLEIAGKREEAAKVWKTIDQLDSSHPIASAAARRLKDPPQESPTEDLRLGDSDSGIDLSPGQVCPHCGAQNSSEFRHCWQCHAPLVETPPNAPAAAAMGPAPLPRDTTSAPRRQPMVSPETLQLSAGVLIAVLLALCIWKSITLLLAADETDAAAHAITRTVAVYTHQVAVSRIVAGLATVLFWPIALRLLLHYVPGGRNVPPERSIIAGLLLGTTTYLLTWLPYPHTWAAPGAAVLLSLVLMLAYIRLRPIAALATWVGHLVLVTIVAFGVFGIGEWFNVGRFFNPFVDLPVVLQYADTRTANERGALGIHALADNTLPIEASVTWRSTGSAWLDAHGQRVTFELLGEPPQEEPYRFEIQDAGGTDVYERVATTPWTYNYRVTPGASYNVIVQGTAGSDLSVVTTGLLEPDFAAETTPPAES